MKKQQLILVGCGLALIILLFFFGKTIPPAKPAEKDGASAGMSRAINIEALIKHAKERLTPAQVQKVSALENAVIRGDIKNQQIDVYQQLASFWRDSIRLFEPYAHYTAESAKLENSEKSLTFAAHLFLNNLKTEGDPAMQHWLGENAKVLFENALSLNPDNDSSKIGLGACYIFGNISDNPMEGIAPIRQIVEKDPGNVFGQMILGLGGIKSGQYDKAIERFLLVVKKQPDNLEALINLAETYERKGDNANAVKYYRVVQQKIPNEEIQKELEERIKKLQ